MKCAFERECATASPSQVDNVEPERRARPPVGTIGGAATGIPDVPISNVSIPARRNGHRRRPCTRAPRRASAQCGTDAAVGVQTLSARVPAAQMRAIAVPDVWPCGRARARGEPRRYRTPPFDIRDRTIRRNMPHMPRATCIPHVERRRNLAPRACATPGNTARDIAATTYAVDRLEHTGARLWRARRVRPATRSSESPNARDKHAGRVEASARLGRDRLASAQAAHIRAHRTCRARPVTTGSTRPVPRAVRAGRCDGSAPRSRNSNRSRNSTSPTTRRARRASCSRRRASSRRGTCARTPSNRHRIAPPVLRRRVRGSATASATTGRITRCARTRRRRNSARERATTKPSPS